MSNFFRTAVIGVSMGVAACAVHPLPEDVTGVPTVAIVNKIRCEAAEAVQQNWDDWKDKLKTPQQMGIFDASAIAYTFTFDITETNFADATLDLTKLITNGTGTAALTGGMDRTRQNTRTFTIIDHFGDLKSNLKNNIDCSQFATGKNYIYPIIGRIGVGEMVNTFVALAFFDNLGGDPTKAGTLPTLGDTIAFTTLIQSSLTPKITLTPVGPSLQVLDSNIVMKASRNDVHKVLIGIAKPIGTPCGLKLFADMSTASPAQLACFTAAIVNNPQTRVGFLVNINGTANPADYAAAHTIEQMITRFELGKPTGTVIVANP